MFAVEGSPTLRVSGGTGRVSVVAEDRSDISVDGARAELSEPAVVTATSRHHRIEARVPVGCRIVIGTLSGSVSVTGPSGSVSVTSASGSVSIERADTVDVRTKSARVRVDACHGHCAIRSLAGRVDIGSAGSADVHSVSGRVMIESADGAITARTVSGRIEVAMSTPADVNAATVSGRIVINIPSSFHPTVDLRTKVGHTSSDATPGDDCRIVARSLSGRLEVVTSA